MVWPRALVIIKLNRKSHIPRRPEWSPWSCKHWKCPKREFRSAQFWPPNISKLVHPSALVGHSRSRIGNHVLGSIQMGSYLEGGCGGRAPLPPNRPRRRPRQYRPQAIREKMVTFDCMVSEICEQTNRYKFNTKPRTSPQSYKTVLALTTPVTIYTFITLNIHAT